EDAKRVGAVNMALMSGISAVAGITVSAVALLPAPTADRAVRRSSAARRPLRPGPLPAAAPAASVPLQLTHPAPDLSPGLPAG
ncbi:hypothetical protein, partial [Streptomyces sp. NPDC002172]